MKASELKPGRATLWLALVVGFACASPTASSAVAAPGDLDPQFGGRGVVAAPGIDRAVAVAAGPSGEVVAAGETGSDTVVTRFTLDAAPDETFAAGGSQIVDLGGVERVNEITVDPLGRILVAGSVDDQFLLARLAPSGGLDPSFAGDGAVVISSLAEAEDVALASDGRIVSVANTDDDPLAVLRFREDGSADPTFGDQGATYVSNAFTVGRAAVAVAADDSVVFGGHRIGRLTADGALDTGFGDQGTIGFFSLATDQTRSLALGPAGEIYAGIGSCGSADQCIRYLLGINARGDITEETAQDEGWNVALGPDQAVYLGGERSPGDFPATFSVSRFSPELRRDRSFGSRGTTVAFAGLRPGETADLAVSPDGSLLVAANVERGAPVLARFSVTPGPPDQDADGVLDNLDRCKRGYSHRPSGCRRVGRRLSARASGSGERIIVAIDSRAGTCISTAATELIMRRRGRDLRIEREQPRSYERTTVDFTGLAAGRYYARVAANDSPLARCKSGRTSAIRIH